MNSSGLLEGKPGVGDRRRWPKFKPQISQLLGGFSRVEKLSAKSLLN